MSATPWYIATGRPVRKNPNGPAGIIRGDVPDGTDKSGYDRTFDGLEGLPEYPKRITIHPRWWIDPIPELSAYGEKHAMMVLMAEVYRLASMTDADF